MILKMTIRPLSYLLPAGNSSHALIDAESTFSPEGFPFLNGKRVKGLFRESLREVLEINQETQIEEKMNRFFGKAGRVYSDALLKDFPNFYLAGWETIKPLLSAKDKDKHPALYAHQIRNHYSSIKMMTAVNEEKVAKDKSLRAFRVINPDTPKCPILFEALIPCQIDNQDKAGPLVELFKKAAANLRFIGTSRNRGLGKVSCKIETLDEQASLKTDMSVTSDNLQVSIISKEAIILSTTSGDRNTIATSDVLSGGKLRGLLATQYILKNEIPFHSANLDNDFFELFLCGNLTFNDCLPQGAPSIPYHMQVAKGVENSPHYDLFANKKSDLIENRITKHKSGRAIQTTSGLVEVEVQKEMNLHSARLNRRAGRSTKNETGIFYYEAVQAGTEFSGLIQGNKQLLQKLVNGLGESLDVQVGKSKSTQYGNAQLKFSNYSNEAKAKVSHTKVSDNSSGQYLLTLLSPLILLDEFGQAQLSKKLLEEQLFDKLNIELKIINAFARTVQSEQYVNLWQAKNDLIMAYGEGSSFLIHSDKALEETTFSLGHQTEIGFGKVRLSKRSTQVEINSATEAGNPNSVTSSAIESHPIFKRIIEKYNEQECLDLIKSKAFRLYKNKRFRVLADSNSMCKRLDNLLIGSNSHKTFKNKMDRIKTQEIGKKLVANFLFDRIRGLDIPPSSEGNESKLFNDFKYKKHFWHWLFYALTKNTSNE